MTRVYVQIGHGDQQEGAITGVLEQEMAGHREILPPTTSRFVLDNDELAALQCQVGDTVCVNLVKDDQWLKQVTLTNLTTGDKIDLLQVPNIVI